MCGLLVDNCICSTILTHSPAVRGNEAAQFLRRPLRRRLRRRRRHASRGAAGWSAAATGPRWPGGACWIAEGFGQSAARKARQT